MPAANDLANDLSYRGGVISIVSGRHRGVGGEDRALLDRIDRVRQVVSLFHQSCDPFHGGEGGVPLVQMVHRHA